MRHHRHFTQKALNIGPLPVLRNTLSNHSHGPAHAKEIKIGYYERTSWLVFKGRSARSQAYFKICFTTGIRRRKESMMSNTAFYNSTTINFMLDSKSSQAETHILSSLVQESKVTGCVKMHSSSTTSHWQIGQTLVNFSTTGRGVSGLNAFCNTQAQVGTPCSRSRLSRICRL